MSVVPEAPDPGVMTPGKKQALLAQLYDSIQDHIFLITVEADGGFRLTAANQAMAGFIGTTSEALVNRRLDELVLDPVQLAAIVGHYRQTARTKCPQYYEESATSATGHLSVFETKLEPILDSLGVCRMISGISRDITDWKKARQALLESEEKYRLLFDAESDALLMLDGDTGLILDANQAAVGLYGYPLEELRTKRLSDLSTQPEKNQRAFDEEWTQVALRWHRRQDGQVFPTEITSSKLMIGEHKIRIIAIRDVTQRMVAEEELRRSEERFRLAIENAPISVSIVTQEGIILYMNRRGCELFECLPEDVVGQQVVERFWVNPAQRAEWLERLRNEGHIVDFEVRYQNLAQTRKLWVLASGVFIQYQGQRVVLTFQYDISQRKEMEGQLIGAMRRAEAASLAKSEFLAHMSHEIRTPLNAVIGYAELLAGLDLDSRHRHYLDSIRIAGKGLLTLINDILDLSRIEAGALTLRRSGVDLPALLAEIGQIFRLSLEQKNLTWQVALEEGVPERMLLDEARLRQVLLNLVGNAVKFTEQGGVRIEVTVRPEGEDGRLGLRIDVIDTGIGIAEEDLSSIFDAFRQPTGQCLRKYGGTGLGLTICRRLAGLMNGEVTVTSQLGRGSTFSLTLREVEPVAGEPGPAVEGEPARETAPAVDVAASSSPSLRLETKVSPEQDEWLRHELAPAMAALNRAFLVDDAVKLALRLKRWGHDAGVAPLTRLAERLDIAARHFDVLQVRAAVALFLQCFPVAEPGGKSG